MKTNIFNTTALALLITTGFIANKKTNIREALDYNLETSSITNELVLDETNVNYVKAKIVDNEIIPVVDLPELNVIENYNENQRVKAKFVNGELMPVVYLPELIIEG